jgi:hypothetical protein
VSVLEERLYRRKRQVEKLKRDKAELRASLALRTEEAYVRGLLENASRWMELDARATELAGEILGREELSEGDLKALRVLLPEISRQRDRAYGKTRQRLESSSVSASVDINELLRQRGVGELVSGDVVDAEVLGEVEGDGA